MVSDTGSGDPQVAHACYRLVQESISNVRRHSPGAAVRIEVRGGTGDQGDCYRHELVDADSADIGRRRARTDRHERTSGVGRRVIPSGATPDGAFVVIAWLPWEARTD